MQSGSNPPAKPYTRYVYIYPSIYLSHLTRPLLLSSSPLSLADLSQALCHCLDCRKITGSTYSTNLVVPNTTFTLTKGSPKEYHHKATDSGNTITLSFCGTCGTTLWSRSSTYGETTVLKAGVLDHESTPKANEGEAKGEGLVWDRETRPLLELYVKRRPAWVAAVEGAVQDEDGAAQREA